MGMTGGLLGNILVSSMYSMYPALYKFPSNLITYLASLIAFWGILFWMFKKIGKNKK